jgi:hypothetical protein
LLSPESVRFVDVRSALAHGENLRSEAAQQKLATFLKYLITFDSRDYESEEFQKLTSEEQKSHQAFWILEGYLEALEDQEDASSDVSASAHS